MSADQHTGALRAATGLDSGARGLILAVVGELCHYSPGQIMVALFRDRYGSIRDYLAAVREVHGNSVAWDMERASNDAAADAEFPSDFGSRRDPKEAAAHALLIKMPEPDFHLAIEDALRIGQRMGDASQRISRICRTRGAPWEFDSTDGFQWVGDEVVERDLVRPALAALHDPRFAGGVRSEFEQARSELRTGTPQSRKQSLHEAGCSVESAMKVLLSEHGEPYDAENDAATALFNRLENANLVPRELERLVLSAATPRNKWAGHGAGAVAHNPTPAEAESVVAGAAGAIAYLQKLLP